MPRMEFDLTDAAAARLIAATERLATRKGETILPTATPAQKWAHAKKVCGGIIRSMVLEHEIVVKEDADLDTIDR